ANVPKRGATCDLGSVDGRALFARLAAKARIVVESFPPGRLAELGLDSVLRDAIVVSVTPYGQDGPLARVPGSDLEVTAASGSLWLAGEEGRPPVRTAQPQSPYWSGMYGALGALVALQSPVAQRGTVPAAIATIDWTVFDNTTLSQPEVDELEAAIAPFLRSLTKAEFFDGVVKRKMLGYPVGDASDSLADPQLHARDFWRHISP